MLRHRAADFRQHLDEIAHVLRLARLAHLLPVRMIAVLQPPRRIAPDGLDVRARVRRVVHVLIGRRHSQRIQPCHGFLVAEPAAVGAGEDEAVARALAHDRELAGRDQM